MIGAISALVVLLLAAGLQSALFAQMTLLQGATDLMLLTLLSWYFHEEAPSSWLWAFLGGLMVGWLSALPWWLYAAAYSAIALLTLYLRRRLWQTSLFTYLFLVVFTTPAVLLLEYGYLRFTGAPISLSQALRLVVFPSLLLNLLFALPVYALVDEWISLFFPQEAE